MARRPLADREGGSVSIYFIALTAAFVLITALLIDFARVAAFRRQAELTVKSGARSVLSSFDPELYSRYGLFVRGGEPADRIFADTLAGNAVPSDSEPFPYLDTRWEGTEVTESRPIADHDILRRQVLEEMKYKAPIDLTIELASRLRGMSGMIEDTKQTVDVLERVQEAYDRREEALDRALERQRSYGEIVRAAFAEEVPNPPLRLTPSLATGNVGHVADISNQYDDYVSKRLEDEARMRAILAAQGTPIPPEAFPRYMFIVAGYESGTSRLASVLSADAEAARKKSERAHNDAREAIEEAKDANEEMRLIAAEAAAIGAAESPASPEQAEAMAELRRKTAEMVLDPSFFAGYEAEIAAQRSQGIEVIGHASSFASQASSVPGSTGKGGALRSEASSLQNGYARFVKAHGPTGTVATARSATFQAHRSQDEERKQEEKKATSEWAGAKRLLNLLSGRSGTPEERAEFDRLQELYERNLQWNRTEAELADNKQADEPGDGRDEALSLSGDLLAVVEDSLLGVRDQLYYSEYAISRLSRYEPAYAKGLLHGGEAPLSIGVQQTEYILYGFHNPSGNIAAAYGEIFAVRLAIRTMEGFVECGKLGNPLLVLVAALVYGIRGAVADLQSLVEKGTIQLSKYADIATTYVDYMRLFLLLHGGSANQTARSIAIMELETGVSFQGAYTYASVEGTASVKLWFFPGLVRMLGRYGSLGGTVREGRYEAAYQADYAYQ
ncbi:hypothetical protein [Cohnella panacarvi]|uniref:hypothetical protein n=1 Tax=Cohnella panacarvi TaxID=400776 RepID=UPI00047D5738|nr:hypothetical protein [Cohnella panacarvi]